MRPTNLYVSLCVCGGRIVYNSFATEFGEGIDRFN